MKKIFILILVTIFFNMVSKGQTKPATFKNAQKFELYLSRNFRFPGEARESGLECIILLSFRVKENGTIDSIKVTGKMMGNDSVMLAAFKNIIGRQDFKWKPAVKRGRATESYVALPILIRFEMGDHAPKKTASVSEFGESYLNIFEQLKRFKNYQLFENVVLTLYGSVS